MDAEGTLLADLAYPFMPADPKRHGATVEVGQDWRLDPSLAMASGADVIVLGRLPDSSSPLPAAALSALARELGLLRLRRRVPGGVRVAAVHRLRPHQLSRGLRGALRGAIRSGAIVELTSVTPGERVLDAVAATAQGRLVGSDVYAGSGGTLLVQVEAEGGRRAVLRLARAGSPGDPVGVAEALERLGRLQVSLAPRLLGRGDTCGASWTLEESLPGHRPARLSRALAEQVALALAGLPRAATAPRALVDDLEGIAVRATSRASRVRQLAARIAPAVADLPAVLRHGDLWLENLLVDRGRLTGFVDWDATHPAGMPGADLLQLVATEQRRRAHQALGQAFIGGPWRSEAFARSSAPYWRALGIGPSERQLEIVGLAWWAVEARWTLTRLPHRARDERWLEANIDPVLATLGV